MSEKEVEEKNILVGDLRRIETIYATKVSGILEPIFVGEEDAELVNTKKVAENLEKILLDKITHTSEETCVFGEVKQCILNATTFFELKESFQTLNHLLLTPSKADEHLANADIKSEKNTQTTIKMGIDKLRSEQGSSQLVDTVAAAQG